VGSEQCVAETGIAVPPTRVSRRFARDTVHPVFCAKSLDLLDYKGVEFFGNDKEFVRVSKGEG
jgi:hypothetical protein